MGQPIPIHSIMQNCSQALVCSLLCHFNSLVSNRLLVKLLLCRSNRNTGRVTKINQLRVNETVYCRYGKKFLQPYFLKISNRLTSVLAFPTAIIVLALCNRPTSVLGSPAG